MLCLAEKKCAMTDTVFFPISEVSTRAVTLCKIFFLNVPRIKSIYHLSNLTIFTGVPFLCTMQCTEEIGDFSILATMLLCYFLEQDPYFW